MEISVYKMPLKPQGGRKSQYSDAFRKQIAEEYLTSGLTTEQVRERHNIPTKATVSGFVSWYRKNFDLSAISLEEGKEEPSKSSSSDDEIAHKDKLLRLARLRIETLEAMIDIAEQELNIDIRKKSGAKPSKK